MTTQTQWPSPVDTFGCSRTGRDRARNDDQFLVASLERSARIDHASISELDASRQFGGRQAHVLLVADGVSGQPAAENASSLVVDEVVESILNAVPWSAKLDVETEAEIRRKLEETVVRCDERVTDAAVGTKRGMASTMTLVFVRWPIAFVVHAGANRAYLVRDGGIEQLTTDQTVAQELLDQGAIAPEEARNSWFANMLWNAVGGSDDVSPELSVKRLHAGDTLLVCSDGVTGVLNDDAIKHVVESSPSARAACDELIGLVAAAGGDDDATVALARFANAT